MNRALTLTLWIGLAACSSNAVTEPDAPFAIDAGGVGKVACASTSCPAFPQESTNGPDETYCCNVSPVADPGQPSFCVQGNLGACESGNPYYCDQAADCGAGLHCCNVAARPGLFRCTNDCSGAELCRTDAECLNGLTCTFRMCAQNLIGTCGPMSDDLARRLFCP